jgi:hypothetical protein
MRDRTSRSIRFPISRPRSARPAMPSIGRLT